MAEQIKKGWLYTREDEKFAPNTLVENVYTRSGTPYDEQVRNYFEAVRRANATTEAGTAAKLSQHDDKLESLQAQLNATNEELEDRLKHLVDEESGKLYITDEAGHVIAYFDENGMHAVDVEIKSGMTVSQIESNVSTLQTDMTEANSQIQAIKNSLVNIDASERDTLYILDGVSDNPEECNVIAYIDEHGIHAVNFLTDDTVDYITLVNNVADNAQAIIDLEAKHDNAASELWKTIEENKGRLDKLDKYFNYDQYTNKFFLVDDAENVIFYVDETGAHTVNLYIENARDYLSLDKALSEVEENIGKLKDEDAKIKGRLDTEERTSYEHTQRLDALDKDIENLQKEDVSLDARLDAEEATSKSHGGRLDTIEQDIRDLKQEDINLDGRLDVEEQTSTEHGSRLDKLETKTQYQDITNDKTFFIVDKDDNVIGYFDEFGLHAVNILSGGSTTHPQVYDLNDELADIHQTGSDLNDAIAAEAKARENADLDLAADISQNEQDIAAIKDVFKHSEFDDAFYFTDSNKNVVAYVDKTGVHAVNIWFGSDTGAEAHGPIRDLISTIEALLLADSNINDMLSNHEGRIDELETWRPEAENADVQLGKRIDKVAEDLVTESSKRDTDDKAINKRIDDLDDKVDNEIERATGIEEGLQTQVSENKQNADTRISYLDRVANFYVSKPANPVNGDLSLEGNNLVIYDGISKKWESFIGLSRQLKEKTQYFDGSSDDKFYITDNAGNVVAYFGADGFHAINMWVGSTIGENHTQNVYDVYTQITNLNSGLNSEISRSTQADEEHDKRLDTIEGRLENVSNVMDFVGVYQTTQERDKRNPNPNNGDVCVVRDVEGKGYDKEFVYANGAWQEIGDVSAEMARLDKLESIVGDPATNVAGTHEARLDGLDRALAQETSDREAGDSAINQTLTSMQNNFSWTDDNKRLYIIDGTAAQNVLAVFYDNGLMIPDVVIKDIKNNKEKNLRSSASYLTPEKDITITWL